MVVLVSQLKVAIVPVDAVWYWRQSLVGIIMFPHSYWVTLICHFLVVVVVPVSMSMLIELQESEAGTHMCCPVLYPQITGGEAPPGLVTVKESYPQSPTLGPSSTEAVDEMVNGPWRTIVSKSILSLQTSEFVLQNL